MNLPQHVAPAPAPHLGSSHSHDELQPTFYNRVTKSGRRLWYKLTVIQQPQRARACGSGPKSSADRRPVDPPPVVELRIFEGNTWEEAEQKDITFLYNANFFLFTTLEHARVMAHGRVQTPAANQPPVLTGMPVSGMAYLDRPSEAGYFLFPDLSVRHEGRYRLTFNLYEETKEDADKDPDSTVPSVVGPAGFTNPTGGSFDFRMEIKSQDFIVFSAKKFPGLSESTALSRVVAEQGCRVRIRRDVRMRKREGGKSGGRDYDNSVEDEYSRRKRTETPELKQTFRPRSTSGSVERGSFSGESQRRPSGAEYPPPFPQTPASAGGHLQFLGNSAQYPPHSQGLSKPPSMPPSPSYQTSQRGHFPPVHQPSPSHQLSRDEEVPRFTFESRTAKPQPDGNHAHQQPPHAATYSAPPHQQMYGQPERPHLPPYAQPNPSPQRETPSHDFRDSSSSSQYREPPHRAMRESLQRQPSKDFSLPASGPRHGDALKLPPIQNLMNSPQASPAPVGNVLPQLLPHAMPTPKSSMMLPPPSAPPAPPAPVAGAKRGRDEPSSLSELGPRYHNGAREDPQAAEELLDEHPLVYHRADGVVIEIIHETCV